MIPESTIIVAPSKKEQTRSDDGSVSHSLAPPHQARDLALLCQARSLALPISPTVSPYRVRPATLPSSVSPAVSPYPVRPATLSYSVRPAVSPYPSVPRSRPTASGPQPCPPLSFPQFLAGIHGKGTGSRHLPSTMRRGKRPWIPVYTGMTGEEEGMTEEEEETTGEEEETTWRKEERAE